MSKNYFVSIMIKSIFKFFLFAVFLTALISCQKNKPSGIELRKNIVDYEDLLDIKKAKSPVWLDFEFDENDSLEESNLLIPTFFIDDFSGDGITDKAFFVNNKLQNKKGVLFLFGEKDMSYLIGAGSDFYSGGDDFKWADKWEVFVDTITYETTFYKNGDVKGSKEIILEHPAIRIREEEGSGGLIYFKDDKFIYIHQGD